MKLTIVGAGSSRLPLMLASVAQAARGCALSEVALFDVRPERVRALLPVALALAPECGALPPVRVHDRAQEALDGAAAVIFTIRPGFEEARASDERACLRLGVIGQETTGPAGFAFASRSLPAVADYCRIAIASNPSCLLAIFTNPAGLVTQGLHRLGFQGAVGVCDSANVAVNAVARRAGVDPARADFEVYGLNHLSWTRRVEADGRDILALALADDAFLASAFPAFAPSEVRAQARIPVEYLWYFRRPAEALAAMLAEPETRGEQVARTNAAMLADVGTLARQGRVSEALVRYAAYLTDRQATYMDYARRDHAAAEGPAGPAEAIARLKGWVGGYAEVAMDLLAGRSGAAPRLMALNVANRGAIPGLADDDVVETDCVVSAAGVSPRPHGALPADDMDLVGRVKEYERLAVRSILEGSRGLAEDALAAHPLVDSRARARALVAALV